MIWSIQDRIALDAGEERVVALKRKIVEGQERVVWNPALSIPAKEFEFSDPDVSRIKAMIETWDSYGVNADRRWLEPLLKKKSALLFNLQVELRQGADIGLVTYAISVV